MKAPGRAGHWWEVLTRTLPGRLVLLLAAVALIGISTAAFGHYVLGAFPSYGEALWSAIAHLVDPGSIGDDESTPKRVIGLLQVVAGIIFFAGIVLTVLTEVVDRALRRLEKGDPAVRRRDHLLIVGFNNSIREVQQHLREELEGDPPQIVVMLPLAESGHRDEVRRAMAGYPSRTTVVAADPGEDGYRRVCAEEARGIVLLSPVGDPDAADLEVTNRATLLEGCLARAGARPPVAVEFRRGRNVLAFWEPDPEKPSTRFPDNFDALVNDRYIGAVLLVAIMNTSFAEILLDDGEASVAPELIPIGPWAGRSFAEARAGFPEYNVLGVLRGTGPDARLQNLPDDRYRLEPGDRLVGLLAPGDTPPPTGGPASVDSLKVAPTRPGSLLMIGWSDASDALAFELVEAGIEPGPIYVLDREPPRLSADDLSIEHLAGDPLNPNDIEAAIDAAGPEIIWVGVPGGNQPGAIISGMLARQQTDVPVLVEQSFVNQDARARSVTEDLTVVSTGGIVAEAVALSLRDPAVVIAREGMVNDPEVALESLTYIGGETLPVAQLREVLTRSGAVPLAVSLEDETGTELRPGDRILAFHRRSAP